MSGETAAIGVGFLLGGPVGAVIGGAAGPVIAAAMMWRNRGREHDETTNQNTTPGSNGRDSSGSAGRGNGGGGGGRSNGGAGRGNGSGGGRHRTPNNSGAGSGGGGRGSDTSRRPKTKDPVADKLSKAGKDLADKLKRSRTDRDKNPKNNKGDWSGKGKGGADPKGADSSKGAGASKGGSGKGSGAGGSGTGKGTGGGADAKTTSRGGLKTKDRGPQQNSPRPWRDRGPKDKNKKKTSKGDDTAATTAPDGLGPKTPKPGDGGLPSKPTPKPDEYIDAELVDDDHPTCPDPDNDQSFPDDDIVDAVIVEDAPDEQAEKKKAEDRIALVRAKRVKEKRRAAAAAGKKAAEKAARNGDMGDPAAVKDHVIRQENRVIDLQIHHENHLIALTQAAEKPRSTPVNYPAIQAAPTGTRTAGVAIARQINVRGTAAYAILHAMADQLAHGLHGDEDADMGDHIVELTGIPTMCKNLSIAVQEASRALARTAPLHPSVIKHLNNAAVAARTAGVMAENIMVVFVQAHREDIIRILDPRIGEERWNIRNAPGTLDAAKLRAAIASAHSTRLALPGGSATSPGGGKGGSKLVPASDGSTRKLIDLMKNFKRGHMVNVLSEVAGSAAGVDAVATSITKMYKRMQKTWPTENVVDDTVARTAGQVRRVSVELHKAIKAAQKAHQRELRLNAKGRAGKGARVERKWDVVGRPSSSN
ncbi:hypothetical protein ACWFRT_13720 [Streptomyces anulatus]